MLGAPLSLTLDPGCPGLSLVVRTEHPLIGSRGPPGWLQYVMTELQLDKYSFILQ